MQGTTTAEAHTTSHAADTAAAAPSTTPDVKASTTPDVKTPSVSVAPKAVDAIARQMQKRGTPDASLRLGIRGGGCSGFKYVIEFHDGPPHARDRLFEFTASDATPVRVVVDPKSLLYLNGAVLDWEQTLMRHGFKFVNPNEQSGCGCGTSFSV